MHYNKQTQTKLFVKKPQNLLISLLLGAVFAVIIQFHPELLHTTGFFSAVFSNPREAFRCSGYVLIADVLLISLLLYWMTRVHKRFSGLLLAVSVLFGIVQTLSMDFYFFQSFLLIRHSKNILFYNLLSIPVYSTLLYGAGTVLFDLLDRKPKASKPLPLWDRHAQSISFFVILLCWSPWLFVFYPGSMWFDMCYQIEQYYGYNYYGLHPIFSTLCMGFCMDIGKTVFSSDNMGVFLYILLQSLVCAYAYSKLIAFLKELQAPRILQFGTLLFFAILPVFGAYAQTGEKDVLAYGLVILFLLAFAAEYQFLTGQRKLQHPHRHLIYTILIGTLCTLYRKEMIIVCLITGGCLFLLAAKDKLRQFLLRQLLIVVGIFVIYSAFNTIVGDVILQVLPEKFSSAEALSIPLQQVARVVYYNDDVLDENEKQILDRSFSYGYEKIAENYNPYLSDYIKYSFNTKEPDFWKVYVSLLKKAPAQYLESIIAGSYGYYSIVPPLPTTVNGAPTNGTPGSRFEFYINRFMDLEHGVVDIAYRPSTEVQRVFLQEYAYAWREVPVLNIFYSLGFYTWMLLLFMVYLISKKNFKPLIIFLPSVLLIGVCIASPVNDCMRYYVSVMASCPLLLGWTFANTNNNYTN